MVPRRSATWLVVALMTTYSAGSRKNAPAYQNEVDVLATVVYPPAGGSGGAGDGGGGASRGGEGGGLGEVSM
jgi:hypothetical protein